MNTITTAAELDALPVGSVLLDLGPDRAEADAPVIACKAADGDWWIAGTPKDRRWRADEILRDSTGSVLICAHRPDATPEPQRVQPSVEDVAKVILSHSGSLGVHYADIANACAEAVLALFAAQPTVAGVKAEALREAAADGQALHAHVPSLLLDGGLARISIANWLRARADRIEADHA